jgi:hypothetical protein
VRLKSFDYAIWNWQRYYEVIKCRNYYPKPILPNLQGAAAAAGKKIVFIEEKTLSLTFALGGLFAID